MCLHGLDPFYLQGHRTVLLASPLREKADPASQAGLDAQAYVALAFQVDLARVAVAPDVQVVVGLGAVESAPYAQGADLVFVGLGLGVQGAVPDVEVLDLLAQGAGLGAGVLDLDEAALDLLAQGAGLVFVGLDLDVVEWV